MSTLTTGQRDRLATTRQRTKAARKRISDSRAAIEIARKAGDAEAEQTLTPNLYAAETELELASEIELSLLSQMAGVSVPGVGSGSFLDDPEVIRTLDHLGTSSQPVVGQTPLGLAMSTEDLVQTIESGAWGPGSRRLAVGTGIVPDAPIGRRGSYDELGVVRQLRRRLRVLDLIPTRAMAGNTVPFTVESGSFDSAAETVEGTLKPPLDIGLTDGEAKAKTIAAWAKASRQILSDVPSIQQVVQDRLTYSVLRRLENQIIAGDGVGENIQGIMATTGIANIAYVAAKPAADAILSGMTAVELSGAEADFILAHPQTAEAIMTIKATGSGEYLSVDSPFGVDPDPVLWGLPFIESPVMPVGKALVGSFQQGAQLWVRQAVFVLLGYDQDDFLRNRISILGEMRAAVTVSQPTAFAVVNLA